jgi:hypothetical protein
MASRVASTAQRANASASAIDHRDIRAVAAGQQVPRHATRLRREQQQRARIRFRAQQLDRLPRLAARAMQHHRQRRRHIRPVAARHIEQRIPRRRQPERAQPRRHRPSSSGGRRWPRRDAPQSRHPLIPMLARRHRRPL